MFTIGEQLYRMTPRDEETLLIEPFFRRFQFTVPLGAGVTLDVTIQRDRAYFLKAVQFNGASHAGAGAFWSRWRVQVLDGVNAQLEIVDRDASSVTGRLLSDGTVGTADGQILKQYVSLDTLLPPGCTVVRLSANRVLGLADADCVFTVHGYALPPGQIGRGFG